MHGGKFARLGGPAGGSLGTSDAKRQTQGQEKAKHQESHRYLCFLPEPAETPLPPLQSMPPQVHGLRNCAPCANHASWVARITKEAGAHSHHNTMGGSHACIPTHHIAAGSCCVGCLNRPQKLPIPRTRSRPTGLVASGCKGWCLPCC